jgi:hypothetical protein
LDQAFSGMLERAQELGRVVTIHQMIVSDDGAARALRDFVQAFGIDRRFQFIFVENSADLPHLTTVELAAPQDYTGVRERLYGILEAEYQAGRITEAIYSRIRGGEDRGTPPVRRRDRT